MASWYSVIQYVPDPVSNERINVGIVGMTTEGTPTFHFLKDWNRVKSFSGTSVSGLREYLGSLEDENLTLKKLEVLSEDVTSSIQFTKPHVSSKEPDQLLAWLSARMLTDHEVTTQHSSKKDVISDASRLLNSAVTKSNSHAAKKLEVKTRTEIQGQHLEHTVDLSLHNGKPLMVATAFSFNKANVRQLSRAVELAFWALFDIKEGDHRVQLALVYSKSINEQNQKLLDQSIIMYRSIGADVVPTQKIASWARSVVQTATD